jgi:hypothetical protein
MHAILIPLLFASDNPAPEMRPVQTLDLAKITLKDARRLKGQRVRVTFGINGPVLGERGEVGILAVGTTMGPIPTYRFVIFPNEWAMEAWSTRDPDRVTVEGIITTRHLTKAWVDGFLREERWDIEVRHTCWVRTR